ncbi:hypothetical protein ACC702_33950 [Rhizobium ruizarguesonis]
MEQATLQHSLLVKPRLSGIYRKRCPEISGNAVPDLVKALSGIQWNSSPRITETRNADGYARLTWSYEHFGTSIDDIISTVTYYTIAQSLYQKASDIRNAVTLPSSERAWRDFSA